MAWFTADMDPYGSPWSFLQSPAVYRANQQLLQLQAAVRAHANKTWKFGCMLEDLPIEHQQALRNENPLALSQAGVKLYGRNGRYAIYVEVNEKEEFSFKKQGQPTQVPISPADSDEIRCATQYNLFCACAPCLSGSEHVCTMNWTNIIIQTVPQRNYRKVHGNKRLTLYHVTDKRGAGGLKETGYRMKRGATGMFGGGIYFAPTIKDATYKAHHHGWLVTANVFVGKELKVKDCNAGKFTFDELWQKGYDSVYAPCGSGNGQPERVVFNEDQVEVLSVEQI